MGGSNWPNLLNEELLLCYNSTFLSKKTPCSIQFSIVNSYVKRHCPFLFHRAPKPRPSTRRGQRGQPMTQSERRHGTVRWPSYATNGHTTTPSDSRCASCVACVSCQVRSPSCAFNFTGTFVRAVLRSAVLSTSRPSRSCSLRLSIYPAGIDRRTMPSYRPTLQRRQRNASCARRDSHTRLAVCTTSPS